MPESVFAGQSPPCVPFQITGYGPVQTVCETDVRGSRPRSAARRWRGSCPTPPLSPRSCQPLAAADVSGLALATAQRRGLDSEDSAETMMKRGGERIRPSRRCLSILLSGSVGVTQGESNVSENDLEHAYPLWSGASATLDAASSVTRAEGRFVRPLVLGFWVPVGDRGGRPCLLAKRDSSLAGSSPITAQISITAKKEGS